MNIKTLNLSDLNPAEYNPRTINDESLKGLENSIKTFDCVELLVVNIRNNNTIISGHQRFKALQNLGIKETDCILVDVDPIQEKALNVAMNNRHISGEWDLAKLDVMLQELNLDFGKFDDINFDALMEEFDFDETGVEGKEKEIHNLLSDQFGAPPFSVLDTKQGYWQDRKRLWKELIQDTTETRKDLGFQQKSLNDVFGSNFESTSILDPVLSELMVMWFAPKNAKIIDCFAGDSVFGFVSSYLKNSFTGIELRKEQAAINQERVSREGLSAKYICDDGQNILKHVKENSQDLLFSCPPYFDLEVYSDLDNDASNQGEYEDFIKILKNAFTDSIKCLKENRFAVIVCGDIRGKNEFYRCFPDDIKKIFVDNGCLLYNDIILLDAIGTAPIRCAAQFPKKEKLQKYIKMF